MPSVILKQGDSGPGVREVRDRLHRLGILQDSANQDVFDQALGDALRIFQQSRGLTVDGIVGPQTFRRLEEARWTLGDRILVFTPRAMIHGDDVAELQRRLIELGFSISRVDGIYGPETEHAVREFQKNVGISLDGICGPEVFDALRRLSRTVSGGSQEHLRELATWDPHYRARSIETCTILIDPSDSDTPLTSHPEFTQGSICWDIANRLEGRLSATGAMVVLTRSSNSQLGDERTRAHLANQQNIDLVLSIAMDHHRNSEAQGVASYYFGHRLSRSAAGMRFADVIQEEVSKHVGLLDVRSHAKTWDILRLTRMPSVRTMLGYSSNEHDVELLIQPAVRDAIADAFVQAIVRILTPKIG